MIKHTKQSGFAMLFTVLIISLILSIAVSISNLTLKQTVLSNIAKDSQIAFYQADAAVECGMYEDTLLGHFPLDATTGQVPINFYCGNDTLALTEAQSNYFVYEFQNIDQNRACYKIVFDKTAEPYRVQGFGYNVCNPNNPRQVERALEVKY